MIPLQVEHESSSATFPGPINYEMADLTFTHGLNRLSGTMTTGQKIGHWLRWTACWRKVNGTWLIVHMQASAPVDLQTGRAVLDLKP